MASETMPPPFGATVRATLASEDNPQRDGMFVRTVRIPRGRMNGGLWWEMTNGHGKFWQQRPENVTVLNDGPLAELDRLRRALEPPVDAEYLSDVEQAALAVAAERDEALAEVERLRKEAVNALVNQAKLKGMSVEDGAALLELENPREIVIAWVWAAREMLGEAPNYSETRIDFPKASMEVKAAGEIDRYVFTVQRAGKVTPHQARVQAERERDEALAEVERMRPVVEAADQWDDGIEDVYLLVGRGAQALHDALAVWRAGRPAAAAAAGTPEVTG